MELSARLDNVKNDTGKRIESYSIIHILPVKFMFTSTPYLAAKAHICLIFTQGF